jgi:hypothetical protein
MKHSKVYYHRRTKLEGLTYDQVKFRPTVDDCEEWFLILNEQVFGNKLPPVAEIRIGRPKWNHALFHYHDTSRRRKYETRITMTEVFSCKKRFVEVLAHEMVHLFQYVHDEPVSHGPSFRAWDDNFALFGLELDRMY